MKILFIAPLPLPITGQSLACQILFDSMNSEHNDVKVINLSKVSLDSGRLSWKRIKEVLFFFKLVWMKTSDVDLIYFNPSQSLLGNLKDLIIYILIFKHLDKTFIHMHGGAGMRRCFNNDRSLLKIINKFFIKRMAGAIVLGGRLTKIYEGMINPNKIFVVPNFSMPEYYVSINKLKKKRAQPFNILFLSNLLPGKGYQDLLMAYKLLPSILQENITLNFAGAFNDFISEEEFLDDIKSLKNVHYHGTVTGAEKIDLLYKSQVFCLPTFYPYEGQPISILEAYASGCVVLTTDHSGIFDIFTPGINGLEIKPQSPLSISHAIELIYNDRGLLRKCSTINVRHARRYYTITKHLSAMHSILFDASARYNKLK